MSSPVHDDIDKRVMYAPPWVRETPKPPQAIVAAVEGPMHGRLKSSSCASHDDDADAADMRTLQHHPDRSQDELPLDLRQHPIDADAGVADSLRAAWTPSSLDPVTMPEPPWPRLSRPTPAMGIRLGGAAGIAALAALFVTGVAPLPSIDIALHANEGTRAASAFAQALGIVVADEPKPAALMADAAPLQSRAPSSDTPPADARLSAGLPSAAVPSEEVVRLAFAALAPPTAPQTPRAPRVENPPASPGPVAPRVPEHRTLDPDEIATLVKRGGKLLDEGDIASARLLLRRAAEAGEAAAALLLAGTYDRSELAKLHVLGVVHDHAQAKAWYEKAAALGSAEAVHRLQQFAQRTD